MHIFVLLLLVVDASSSENRHHCPKRMLQLISYADTSLERHNFQHIYFHMVVWSATISSYLSSFFVLLNILSRYLQKPRILFCKHKIKMKNLHIYCICAVILFTAFPIISTDIRFYDISCKWHRCIQTANRLFRWSIFDLM